METMKSLQAVLNGSYNSLYPLLVLVAFAACSSGFLRMSNKDLRSFLTTVIWMFVAFVAILAFWYFSREVLRLQYPLAVDKYAPVAIDGLFLGLFVGVFQSLAISLLELFKEIYHRIFHKRSRAVA